MFTLGMRESYQACVTLPLLLASELEVLISCSYSGALPLRWSCVFEITSTALQLQHQPALSLCFNFLQQELNPQSCLDVVSFAEAYEIVQLLEVADDFVLRQFQKVACTSKFKDLPAKQLLKYLNSHSLCVSSELVVFKAVAAWIQAKPKKRFKLAKELMKTIHFSLMTFKEFREVQSLKMWSDHSLAELYESVLQDFCSSETAPQSQCRIYLPKESLVLIGGDQISEDLGSRSISRELWFGNSLRNHTGIKKALEWRKLGEMPEPARFSHEVAVLSGQLYIFGGKKYYGSGDTLNSVYRYDPVHSSWESLAEMQEKRCSFSVVVLDGKIYAIGGHCDPEHIHSVEQYCPTANSWSFTWPLDLPLSGHVAKVLQGKIFISGGRNSDIQCVAHMFLYYPETRSTYLANMTKPRAHHCMETLGECLYVAGGTTTDENMSIVDQLACEAYNPATDSWTAFTSLPLPHVGAGSAVLEDRFYVLGGYSQEDYSDTKMVHRYDPTTRRWENMGKMPGPNNDLRASVLCLPPHFRL
uniref:BACK domain-containing protein n=2 Tax=Monopterus albus TaxID=43700 RepID=A0A3Q3IXX4_MONAL